MTTTANGPGAAAVVPLLSRILIAAEGLRSIGAEPQRAIAVPLRECDLPHDLAAVVKAAWAIAVGSDGSGPGALATAQALARILAPADLLCSIGAEPFKAINVLRWIDAPRELKSVARDAWAFAVGSGAVARAAWAFAVGFDDDDSDDDHPRPRAIVGE
jgi:hypothetical protein